MKSEVRPSAEQGAGGEDGADGSFVDDFNPVVLGRKSRSVCLAIHPWHWLELLVTHCSWLLLLHGTINTGPRDNKLGICVVILLIA